MAIVRPPRDEAAIFAGLCELPATSQGRWIPAATILGSSMTFIDGTAVNVALPVVEWYALFLSALLLIGGSLGDLYGRRKVFSAGVALFTAASVFLRHFRKSS